jgi:hypothetical protein
MKLKSRPRLDIEVADIDIVDRNDFRVADFFSGLVVKLNVDMRQRREPACEEY